LVTSRKGVGATRGGTKKKSGGKFLPGKPKKVVRN